MDASGDAGLTANEAVSFERHDHLVDRGWADLKVALQIGLETLMRALMADKVIPVCRVRSRRGIRVADLDAYLASTVQP